MAEWLRTIAARRRRRHEADRLADPHGPRSTPMQRCTRQPGGTLRVEHREDAAGALDRARVADLAAALGVEGAPVEHRQPALDRGQLGGQPVRHGVLDGPRSRPATRPTPRRCRVAEEAVVRSPAPRSARASFTTSTSVRRRCPAGPRAATAPGARELLLEPLHVDLSAVLAGEVADDFERQAVGREEVKACAPVMRKGGLGEAAPRAAAGPGDDPAEVAPLAG